jgi:monoamine oxidase
LVPGNSTAAADVLVIGAGAAGLAAADVLSRAGRSVVILEARARVGGRCWTLRMPGLDVPVELGAEFIHGEAAATYALLHRARIAAVMANREQRSARGGRLVRINSFLEARRAVEGARLDEDVSFDQFLAGRRIPSQTKTFARMMVEGFDAADPARVSARSIIEEWGSLGAQPRPQGGYGALMEWLARSVLRKGARLRLESPVHGLRWRRGAVQANGVKAKRAIVTLPLSLIRLQEKREALRKLAMGPVIRVALAFHEEFWRRRSTGAAFFHNPKAAFPTFWTPLPMRAPLLTCWAGGPKAARLTGKPRATLVAEALRSVRTVFGRVPPLMGAYVQDWHADRWSRGGYSYVLVGGEGARDELARPVADTLYFAGEATDVEEAGTVAGALRSGRRAAKEILGTEP